MPDGSRRNESNRGLAAPAMNLIPDQVILTRVLTAGRRKGDPPVRTCVVMRPFHALTNYARVYSSGSSPSAPVMKAYRDALLAGADADQEKRLFWHTLFREENDPYVKMLENVSYASFFLAMVPRLDIEKNLPRIEFVVPSPTGLRDEDPWETASEHRNRLINALY